MNIALLGYGKMGKRIDELASARGHQILLKLGSRRSIEDIDFTGIDIAIEFSSPQSAYNNISTALSQGIPVVSGSTGWLDRLDEIHTKVREKNTAFLYASNFSLGVNILFALNQKLASLLAPNTSYDISIDETHHTTKKDAPSGTAITLAEGIISKSCDRFDQWELESKNDDKLAITSHRIDDVPGTHEIKYSSKEDVIKLSHEARNRDGFVIGAILAAEYLVDKKGIHQMTNVLNI